MKHYTTIKNYGLLGGELINHRTVSGLYSIENDGTIGIDDRRKRIRSIKVIKEYARHILCEITVDSTGETFRESLNKCDLASGFGYFQLKKED